jgi:hypothetical protein
MEYAARIMVVVLMGALSLSSAAGCFYLVTGWNPFKPVVSPPSPDTTPHEPSLQGPLSAADMKFYLSIPKSGDYELKVYHGGASYTLDRGR